MAVLIFKGMKVGIQEGDFQISVEKDGGISSRVILSTSYSTIPMWMKIAKDSCEEAKARSRVISEAWPSDEEDQRRVLLAEFGPSMQAIVALAIAIDALYGLIISHARLDQRTLDGWRRNRTARKNRICEVFRRVFTLDKDETANCRKIVGEIMHLRDRAVHPSHELRRTMVRPDVGVDLDWRFVAYRSANSHTAYDNTIRMLLLFLQRNSSRKEPIPELLDLARMLTEHGISK